MWTIFRRELGAYFNSAIAIIFVIVFVIFNNGLFMLQFFQIGKADMRMFFNALPYALTIFIPAISMRLWAEEKKGSTFELLLTLPLKPHDLVLGKYFAAFVFTLFSLGATLTVPVMLSFIGRSDLGPIAGGYLGAILMGGMFLAVGTFISGLTKDQIVAFILSMVATFALYFVGTDTVAGLLDGSVSGLGTFLRNSLGTSSHLAGFGRGIVDVGDILYFVVITVTFLFLNGLSLEGRFRPKAKIVYSAAIAVGFSCIILANALLEDMGLGRFDLTEGKIYTISDLSTKILKELKAPVQAKLYISSAERMPTILKTLEQDITDKLGELEIHSGGQFRFKVVHLDTSEIDNTLRESLEEQGVVPFQVESVQKDEVGVKVVYSALVIEYKEKRDLLPRVLPSTINDFEYQVVSRVYKMTLDQKPKIAVFAPPEKIERTEAEARALGSAENVKDHFKTATLLIRDNGYQVSRITLAKDDSIPDNTRLFFVLRPGELSERQRYEINKYLYQGGTVVITAQGYEYSFIRAQNELMASPKKLSLSVNALIEKWGLKIDEEVLLDANSQVIALTTDQRIGPFAMQVPIKFPNQILVDESQFNRNQPLMSRLPSLAYLWGSSLSLVEKTISDGGLRSTTLFTSSRQSWKFANPNQENLGSENTQMPATGPAGPYPLAVLIEGQFSNTFGDKAPAWKEGELAEDAKMGEPKPGRLLVVGASSIFSEDLIQNAGNVNFFANTVDGLALNEDLIRIRSKLPLSRDIRKLSNAKKTAFRFFTVLFVPILLAGLAVIRSFLRKKEKEFYLQAASPAGH